MRTICIKYVCVRNGIGMFKNFSRTIIVRRPDGVYTTMMVDITMGSFRIPEYEMNTINTTRF